MNQIKIRRCPACRKHFEYATEKINHQRKKPLRNKRDATCSKPCSKIYQDCIKFYRNKIRMENKIR